MEIDEHWRHSNRRQVIKVLGHLLDARKAINFTDEHIKCISMQSESCKAIQNNITALSKGLEETIKICGQAADEFKQAMTEPDATPAPIRGKMSWVKNLSPMQRALVRDGSLDLKDTPNYVTPKRQARAPAPMPFTLKRTKPQPKSRARDKEKPPL